MEIPKGWRKCLANEICSKITKGTTPPKQDVSTTGSIPFLRVNNLTLGGARKLDGKIIFVNKDCHNNLLSRSIAQAGDTLISIVGPPLGKSVLLDKTYDSYNLNQAIVIFRPIEKLVNNRFLFFQINSSTSMRWLERNSKKTSGQQNLTIATCKDLPLLCPSIEEQSFIVGILETWERAIAVTEELISQSEAQKKALMQQLLTGKRRLPGFEGEWREVRLGDLGAITSAGVDKKIVEGEQTVRLLNFLDAFRREFIKNEHLTHEVTAPDRKIKKCNVKKGDVFLTPTSETRLDIGLAAVAVEDMPGVCYSYHVVRFRPSEHLQETFSTYALQTDHYKRQAYRLGDGSGQRYVISQDGFRSITILVPEVEEQLAIGKVLSDCSVQIQALQNKLQTLKTEKAALMQQLLTGKRRVKMMEVAA